MFDITHNYKRTIYILPLNTGYRPKTWAQLSASTDVLTHPGISFSLPLKSKPWNILIIMLELLHDIPSTFGPWDEARGTEHEPGYKPSTQWCSSTHFYLVLGGSMRIYLAISDIAKQTLI